MQLITDAEVLTFRGKQESQWIERASNWTNDVINRINNGIDVAGDTLPWAKTHNKVRLRPNEVSLWGAYNGHGKSQILNHICAWGLPRRKWLIASMEMTPGATMQRMNRQVAGTNQPSDDFVRRFMRWTDDRLWIYDQTDTVKSERILAMAYHAASAMQINHIVIDSLMKCGLGRNESHSTSNAQMTFVDRLCWLAKSTGAHLHIIHHMRKGQDEYHEPDKMDFRGAGEITDLVDNVFIIHRNKRKEEKIRQNLPFDISEPDCTLRCAKQRNGEWEGAFNLWFNHPSQQYTPNADNRVMPYEFTSNANPL